ncbi:MAG: magnesium transporter [Halanaerobiales bacterium]|nr:magnesium transporter [Halanaerobiales bacterium]
MVDDTKNLKQDIFRYIKEDAVINETWIEDNYPIDIAETLFKLEDDKIAEFTDLLASEDLAKIIEQAEEELQITILKKKNIEQIVEIISYMAKDNIADILGNLPISLRKELLKHMKKDEASTLKKLLGYNIESAGGLMTTEYILLKKNISISQALDKIKEIGPKTEVIDTIYIMDTDKSLIGKVDLRDIFNYPNEIKLEEIMEDNLITVSSETDQEIVAQQVAKYNLSVIPVVNKNNYLLGIITVDDIIDVIEAENTEDMFKMVGVNEEESINSPLRKSIIRRLPWLYINLGTAFLAALTVGLFEDVIVKVVALAAAMPIVAGMGGNAGTQTLSIVIRGIALGELENENKWKLLLKESTLGILHGLAIGAVTGLILYLIYGNPYLGLIIFAAMIINLLLAGLFGFLIPIGLQTIGVDPALASAIFLTTATDVFGFFAFLGLARLFIDLLI